MKKENNQSQQVTLTEKNSSYEFDGLLDPQIEITKIELSEADPHGDLWFTIERNTENQTFPAVFNFTNREYFTANKNETVFKLIDPYFKIQNEHSKLILKGSSVNNLRFEMKVFYKRKFIIKAMLN